MVSSKETSPTAYLASLPPERRKVISKMRSIIKKNLPNGYVESMNWGMLAYEIPLSRYPKTYNKQPLMYLGLAAQKNNYSFYMLGLSEPEKMIGKLGDHFRAAGRKFNMGRGCLRFNSLDELPLDLIAKIVASTSVERRIEIDQAAPRKKK